MCGKRFMVSCRLEQKLRGKRGHTPMFGTVSRVSDSHQATYLAVSMLVTELDGILNGRGRGAVQNDEERNAGPVIAFSLQDLQVDRPAGREQSLRRLGGATDSMLYIYHSRSLAEVRSRGRSQLI